MYTEKQIRVFEAVLDLARQGQSLHTVKVSDIAARAGMGKGTLYEYFASREEILVFTMLWCMDGELAAMEQALRPGAGFAQDLKALQQCILDCLQTRGNLYRLLISGVDAALPELARTYHAQAEQQKARAQQLKERLIEKGRAEGAICPACSQEYCRDVIDAALFGALTGPCAELPRRARHSLLMAQKALA